MKKILALLGFTLLMSLEQALAAPQDTTAGQQPAAGKQAGEAKQPQWKSREEYDAFQTMVNEKDSHKRISLADAFLQKYPNSDFKDAANVAKMQSYQQLGDAPKAIDAAHQALQANPDNLGALNYVSFAFP